MVEKYVSKKMSNKYGRKILDKSKDAGTGRWTGQGCWTLQK